MLHGFLICRGLRGCAGGVAVAALCTWDCFWYSIGASWTWVSSGNPKLLQQRGSGNECNAGAAWIYIVNHCSQLCWFVELALRVTSQFTQFALFASEDSEVFESLSLLHAFCTPFASFMFFCDPSFRSKVCSATAPNGTAAARPNASRHR